MEKILSPEEKAHIDELLRRHHPEEMEKGEMTVTSSKGMRIMVKTEAASTSTEPFKK